MKHNDRILILDFGSQYTQLIARRIRELHVYSEIRASNTSAAEVAAFGPAGVVLSGGPSSVYDEGAPDIDPAVLHLGLPVLGICYGMQLLARAEGGVVAPGDRHEYGRASLNIDAPSPLLHGFAADTPFEVWMSHGDTVTTLPAGFARLCHSASAEGALGHGRPGQTAAIADEARRIYGLQFHPEVAHTPRGAELLANFVFGVCGCSPSWTMGSFIETAISDIQRKVGEHHVLCALSGGVDSSVVAALLHRAIGPRLQCVFVDNGLLRQGESDQVLHLFRDQLGYNLVRVEAADRFLDKLVGVTDPEQKRKLIGREFIAVFEDAARELGHDLRFLAQGTLYPDVIESISHKGPSATIKSHHNVGGLPERLNMALIEPVRELFKDEVRLLGEELGLPRHVLWRQPFPGPGLSIRCAGEVTAPRLHALRAADRIVDEELRAAGLYDDVWQCFPVLLPVRSVGVMGDQRSYEECCAIRAVTSSDGMTADWARLPYELLARMSTRIINEVRGINRVLYDISSKPPATIEWE